LLTCIFIIQLNVTFTDADTLYIYTR